MFGVLNGPPEQWMSPMPTSSVMIRMTFGFAVRAARRNHFGGMFAFHASDERGDPQIVGADVIERRDAAAQRVVSAAEDAGPFDGQDVRRLLDHAEQRSVAVGRCAEFAE